jgi:ATP-dependent exoDNAse (exonuclease V) beta subunit
VVIFPYAKQQIDYTLNSHLWVTLPEKYKLPFALITKPGKDINHPLYSENYLDLINNLEMENINIFYVALTRAAQELFIVSEDDRIKGGGIKLNTFSGLFMSFIKQTKNLDVESNTEYNWGKPSSPKQEVDKNDSLENKELKFHSPSPDLNLNLVTTAGKLWNKELEEALDKGNIIHSILSKIERKEDSEYSINKHLEDGYIGRNEEIYYKELVNLILSHEDLSEYFKGDYEVWNEKDIYFQNKLLRPDRVNLKGKDTFLIDYKTGTPQNQHKHQINEYAEALSSLKYNVKKKLLVYINNSIEVKIV